MAVFAALAPVKLVVVVDEDIDVFDDEMVGWAVATRFQADRDLLVIPHTRSGGLDPSAEGGPTAKLVVDATVAAEKRQSHVRMRSTTTGSARLSELMGHLEPSHA
jgi:2,5-furandicarboxylate decarboxylase 1